MGITEDQFKIVWRAILQWMRERRFSVADLADSLRGAGVEGYSEERIAKGIVDESEWITSDFVHGCVVVLGLTNARKWGPEEMADVLTDEECVELLTSILRGNGGQGRLRV